MHITVHHMSQSTNYHQRHFHFPFSFNKPSEIVLIIARKVVYYYSGVTCWWGRDRTVVISVETAVLSVASAPLVSSVTVSSPLHALHNTTTVSCSTINNTTAAAQHQWWTCDAPAPAWTSPAAPSSQRWRVNCFYWLAQPTLISAHVMGKSWKLH